MGRAWNVFWSKPSSTNDLFMNSLNWLLWTKNLCFSRGHTCSIWLVENSASIIFHIFIFEPWNFFTDGFAHSPRLVLDQMTLHRYCGPLSFRCQRCPHRGRGNSSHFLFHRHAPHAVQTGKGETFYQYFFPKEALMYVITGRFGPESKDEEVPWIGNSTPYIQIQRQGQSSVPRLCGVNRVLLTAACAGRLKVEHVFHILHELAWTAKLLKAR